MLREIEQHIESLRVQRDLIEVALRDKAPTMPNGGASDPAASARKSQSPRPQGRRGTVREILHTRPDHEWLPAEVRTELLQRGAEATSAAVRVMLRRMGEDGEIVRMEHGWKLASQNGSEGEPNSGPSENGTRDPLFTDTRPQEAVNE